MSKFDINIDDLIKFFKEAGCEIKHAAPGEKGGFYIDGKRVEDVGKVLREAFKIPINIDEYIGEKYE